MTTGWFAYNMMVNSMRDSEEREHALWNPKRDDGARQWVPMEYGGPSVTSGAPMILTPSTDAILSAANEVFNSLGSGHSEAIYEAALAIELKLRGFAEVRTQVPHPIYYKGRSIGTGYIDIQIGNRYIIELKTVAKLTSKDEAQVLKYRTNTLQACILVNFNPSSGEVEVRDCGEYNRTSGDRDGSLLSQQGHETANPRCDYHSKSTAEGGTGEMESEESCRACAQRREGYRW